MGDHEARERDVIDRFTGESGRQRVERRLLTWMQFAIVAFTVGVAWANLHAELVDDKIALEAEIATMRTDIHAMKVLACRAYPEDSVCAVGP